MKFLWNKYLNFNLKQTLKDFNVQDIDECPVYDYFPL